MLIRTTPIVFVAVALLGCGDFPSNPSTPDALNGVHATSLAIMRHGDVLCAATAGNHVMCLPVSGSFGVLSTASLPAPVLALAGGYDDMCALLSDETVRCWRVDQPTTPAVAAQGAVDLTVSSTASFAPGRHPATSGASATPPARPGPPSTAPRRSGSMGLST